MISRRELIAGAATAMAGNGLPAVQAAETIDAHGHLAHHSRADWREADRQVIEAYDKLGIDQGCCSILTGRPGATPDEFRECNQWVCDAMRRFCGRILGYAFVNPGYSREAVEEVRRCVDDRGFVGIKLYNDYVVTEPVVTPLIELAIQLQIPILHHAGHLSWLPSPQPRISDGAAFAEIGRRYPDAMIICAHICGEVTGNGRSRRFATRRAFIWIPVAASSMRVWLRWQLTFLVQTGCCLPVICRSRPAWTVCGRQISARPTGRRSGAAI